MSGVAEEVRENRMRYRLFAIVGVAALMACGSPTAAPTVNVGPTQTRAAEVAQIAALQATANAPTATPKPTNTPVPPTATAAPPTATALPPTATPDVAIWSFKEAAADIIGGTSGVPTVTNACFSPDTACIAALNTESVRLAQANDRLKIITPPQQCARDYYLLQQYIIATATYYIGLNEGQKSGLGSPKFLFYLQNATSALTDYNNQARTGTCHE